MSKFKNNTSGIEPSINTEAENGVDQLAVNAAYEERIKMLQEALSSKTAELESIKAELESAKATIKSQADDLERLRPQPIVFSQSRHHESPLPSPPSSMINDKATVTLIDIGPIGNRIFDSVLKTETNPVDEVNLKKKIKRIIRCLPSAADNPIAALINFCRHEFKLDCDVLRKVPIEKNGLPPAYIASIVFPGEEVIASESDVKIKNAKWEAAKKALVRLNTEPDLFVKWSTFALLRPETREQWLKENDEQQRKGLKA